MLNIGKQSNSPFKRDSTTVACSIEGLFVIHLKRSEERLKIFQDRIQKENLPVSIWEAVDGTRLDAQTIYDAGASAWALQDSSKKRRGEIGCFLSHRSLWSSLLRLPHIENSGYLILEDDVCFEPGFIGKLSNALRYVPPNWDLVYVGCGAPEFMDGREGERGPVKRIKSCEGTYGYILRANTIPRIVQHFWLIGEPIDTTLNRLMKHLNVYALVNPLITPDTEVESIIRGGK